MTSGQFTVEAIGVRWRVDAAALDAEHQELLRGLWSRMTVPDDPQAPAFTVRLRDEAAAEPLPPRPGVTLGRDLAHLPYDFSRALTRDSIERQIGHALMLHAAGLARRDGSQFLALVAPSGTGKSTAAAILGRRFGYLSDETVAITEDLVGMPYPKPLSLIPPGGHPMTKHESSPDDAGLGPTPHGARLAAVVLLDRVVAQQVPVLEPVDLLTGMLDVLAQSSSVVSLPDPLDWLARAVSAGGGPYRLRYGEIAACGDLLESLFARAQPAPVDWVSHLPAEHASWVPLDRPWTSHFQGGPVVRAPWTAALQVGDEVLVMLGPTPLRLSGLGPTIWLAAAEPTSLADLTEAVVATHGEHPQAAAHVEQAVRELTEVGVLWQGTARRLPEGLTRPTSG